MLVWTLVVLVSGCAKKNYLDYEFDGYKISIPTREILDNQKVSDLQRAQNIEAIAIQRSQTWYKDSLIISNIDLSQLTLDKFMTLNKKTLESRFAEYNESKYSDLSFECKKRKIAGKLFNYDLIVSDQKIYFSQYLFSRAKSGFMISLSSEDKKQIKLFKKSVQDISCD